MQMFILTLQENIFNAHHLVDFPVTVNNMTVANVSHSASMTHSCMHHSPILFSEIGFCMASCSYICMYVIVIVRLVCDMAQTQHEARGECCV